MSREALEFLVLHKYSLYYTRNFNDFAKTRRDILLLAKFFPIQHLRIVLDFNINSNNYVKFLSFIDLYDRRILKQSTLFVESPNTLYLFIYFPFPFRPQKDAGSRDGIKRSPLTSAPLCSLPMSSLCQGLSCKCAPKGVTFFGSIPFHACHER